jgi:hypothetical protein
MVHAVRAVRQARAAVKEKRQARQEAFAVRCQAAARESAEAAFMAPHYTERMKLEFTLALKSAYAETANA